MERILLLMAAPSYLDAEPAVLSAAQQAASAQRLTFGLCLAEEPDEESLQRMRGVSGLRYLAPWQDAWHATEALWQGETFILIANTGLRFASKWDIGLIHAWRKAPLAEPDKALLSGCLPEPADPVDAVRPIGVDGFDEGGDLIPRKGTPLRYAEKPQRALLLSPGFCFGPAAFFRAAEHSGDAPWITALREGWQPMTLHRPLLRQNGPYELPPFPCPQAFAEEMELGTQYGVHADTREAEARARTGLFSTDLSYPMRPPAAVRAQEAAKAQARVRAVPLMVTAMLPHLMGHEPTPEETMHDFAMLCSIKALPLVAFGDTAHLRWMEPLLANTVEFKKRYGLRLPEKLADQPPERLMPLSKAALLAQARERQLNHTHYGWLDPDALRWPVAPFASLQWDAVCTDAIVLAIVDGKPDTTAVIVPENYVLPLRETMAEQCRAALWGTGALPEETELWRDTMKLHPDWFRPVELPEERRLLSLILTARGEEFHTEA